MDFYTNVICKKSKIYVRGIKNGEKYTDIVKYKPYHFLNSDDSNSPYRNIHNEPVRRKDFSSIYEAREYCKKYEEVEGYKLYGLTLYEYAYIYDNYESDIKFNPSDISVVIIDIENSMKIPCDIHRAVTETPNEITSITLTKNGHSTTLSTVDYTPEDDETYYKCNDEWHLLKTFLMLWESPEFSPDVVSGYNCEFYDIPYIYNRIVKVLGEDQALRLSPYRLITPYEIEVFGKKAQSYVFEGISTLDYMVMYKSFVALYKPQEKYTLDHIAYVELGENKIDYKSMGYKNLDDLFEKNPQLYIKYNIRDCKLIERMDKKLNLFNLIFTIAYRTKVNYTDVFGSVLKWDCMIHAYLMDRNIVVEPSLTKQKTLPYPLVGGYIKEPTPGMYNWTAYFDLTSLYPKIVQQYAISPENFVKRTDFDIDEFLLIDKLGVTEETRKLSTYKSMEYAKEHNLSLTANGCLYRRREGFIPAIMKSLGEERDVRKSEMLKIKQQYVNTNDESLIPLITSLDTSQTAIKLIGNEGYGAIANKWNRWFNFNMAESITTGGRLTIRWTERKFNEYLNKLYKTDNIDYVIYMVTDSCILNMDRLVKEVMPNEKDQKKISAFLYRVCKEKLLPYIDKCYNELAIKMNAYQQQMNLKVDNISERFLIRAKSQYMMNVWNQEGVVYNEPKLVMKGIKAVKISTPEVCKKVLKEAFSIIMSGEEKDLQKLVRDFKKEFSKMEFHVISTPGGTNTLNSYPMINNQFAPKTPIGVRAAHTYNNMIKKLKLEESYELIGQGDKIRYGYLRLPNPCKSNAVACIDELPEEFNLKQYIDYNLQFDKTFLDTLNPILDTVGWKANEIRTIGLLY